MVPYAAVLEGPGGFATIGERPLGIELREEVLLLVVEVVHPLLQRLGIGREVVHVEHPVSGWKRRISHSVVLSTSISSI